MDASWVCRGGSSKVVLTLAFNIVLLFVFLPQIGAACASWCGKMGNIRSPFRLKADPYNNCGNKTLELECIDDVVVLRILSAEFYVQSIDYDNYTIRLVDPNFHDSSSNCSSLPRYFLSHFNFFSDSNNTSNNQNEYVDPRFYLSGSENLIYMKCSRAVRGNPYFLDTSSCLMDPHIYAVRGDVKLADVEIGCHVMASTLIRSSFYDDEFFNLSYVDIHRHLQASGFELSWRPSACQITCGSTSCFHFAGGQVQCHQTDDSQLSFILRKKVPDILFRIFKFFGQILKGMYFAITSSEISDVDHPPQVSIGFYGLIYLLTFRIFVGILVVVSLILPSCFTKWKERHSSVYENIEHFLQHNKLMPIRYTYEEIKKMTGNFKERLGEGGFGTVYKGKLRCGSLAAIKMLGKSKANGLEFTSEVETIGRIHHINVVYLIGFCVEGSKRALVYEYMTNGSLDKCIFHEEGSVPLNYQKIHEIAFGVARGIAYLHHGCDKKILHFDIKPHNILLDDNFIPKISDFGLAKLCSIDNSIITFTAAKGTIGYIAPELFYKNIGGVSYKADIYSFGKLLMEMVSRRRNSKLRTTEHSSQNYFPLWIYDQFAQEKDVEMEGLTYEEKDLVKKMFIIAWWCIQFKPADRPSMNKVVEMLEADVESLEMPPKPLLYPQETIASIHGSNSDQASCSESVTCSSYASDDIPQNSAS